MAMALPIKNNVKLGVVIPAAGIGSRFNASIPKQYAVMQNQRTVLDNTLTALFQHPAINTIMLVLHSEDSYWQASVFNQSDRIATTLGGHDRAQSVLNGLLALGNGFSDNDWVLVHDACRPYVSYHDLDQLLVLITTHHAVGGLLAVPLTDTIKTVDKGCVTKTVSREHLWRAQTPQLFRYGLLKKALIAAMEANFLVTDESSAVEFLGLHPVVVQGSTQNIKITYPEDLEKESQLSF